MPPRHIPPNPPPWWPENEPWPPSGPPHWRGWRNRNRPGRFFWRMGCGLIMFMLLAFSSCAVITWLVVTALGVFNSPNSSLRLPPFLALVVLVLGIGGIVVIGRNLRRATQPIDEMMEAAGRVAAGDYAARVAEHGPREVRHLTHAFNMMTGRLQTNDEQRRRLLADISHELRTPLTVIQGNLEGMLDGLYQPDAQHLESILEETQVMSRLIEDLRTLALTESGALKLQHEPTDLGLLTNEAIASFRGQAQAVGVQLEAEVAPDLPLIEIDPVRIRQVLTNLIANALRYTLNGGQIQVRCAAQVDALEVVVHDTGRGIAPQDLPHIFDRYYKSSDSRGTGLGLAIAQSLVTAHGGEIRAQSEVGQGTTITFTLPVKNLSGA